MGKDVFPLPGQPHVELLALLKELPLFLVFLEFFNIYLFIFLVLPFLLAFDLTLYVLNRLNNVLTQLCQGLVFFGPSFPIREATFIFNLFTYASVVPGVNIWHAGLSIEFSSALSAFLLKWKVLVLKAF